MWRCIVKAIEEIIDVQRSDELCGKIGLEDGDYGNGAINISFVDTGMFALDGSIF